jgi:hypothetical protein
MKTPHDAEWLEYDDDTRPVTAPTPERCVECGKPMDYVHTVTTGVCPVHGVQPAACSADAGEAPTLCDETEDCPSEDWHYWRCPKYDGKVEAHVPSVPVGDETEVLHRKRFEELMGEGLPWDDASGQAWEEIARTVLARVAGLEAERDALEKRFPWIKRDRLAADSGGSA